MSSYGFRRDEFSSLVGVIDLMAGRAVAAFAGMRDRYRPIESIGGDPLTLVRHYGSLGCGGLYLADLDAIGDARPHIDTIHAVVDAWSHQNDSPVYVDAGYRGDAPAWMDADTFSAVHWIVASETCRDVRQAFKLIDAVGGQRIALSLDFRGPRFLGIDWPQWIETLCRGAVSSAIVLNLEDVGSAQGGQMDDSIAWIRNQCPDLNLIGGGGVRDSADLARLTRQGCDQVLVATAIRPTGTGKPDRPTDGSRDD